MRKQKCDRCGERTLSLTMSYFNTEMICPECDKKEKEHPEFEEARKKEEEAVKQGNYNFEGGRDSL
ncbi:hypothetical protein AKJ57_03550 [candidate division MSBL1 archaeon SCGC-AAA259A05]|uniref:Gamma-glutamylcyclotransferase n=1 Tax=candidate division MSBL1 archaeon SCGC-AAA259A05 TaxID=1698259 RepID=A0A133U9G6_9EURY|nr:hypothetical protein AKJ57_03550 [candidate division MSBL1 archaeon SCGC-AAA259A05]